MDWWALDVTVRRSVAASLHRNWKECSKTWMCPTLLWTSSNSMFSTPEWVHYNNQQHQWNVFCLQLDRQPISVLCRKWFQFCFETWHCVMVNWMLYDVILQAQEQKTFIRSSAPLLRLRLCSTFQTGFVTHKKFVFWLNFNLIYRGNSY